MRTPTFLLPLIAALAGCVSQQKYDDLQRQLDETSQAMQAGFGERDRKITDLETALAAEQARAAELEKARAVLEARLAELDQARGALDERLTGTQADKAKLQKELERMMRERWQLNASVAEMRQALAELESRKAQADARVAEYKSFLARFKKLVDAGTLRVKIVDGRMVVEVGTDVLFASGQATLSPEGKKAITDVAKVLAGIPGRSFQVEGHTDDRPIKTAQFPSNWELAAARALTVVKTMIEAGLPASQVSGASYGEFKPARPNQDDAGRQANRRIEIVVQPDLSALPGFEDLQRLGEEG